MTTASPSFASTKLPLYGVAGWFQEPVNEDWFPSQNCDLIQSVVTINKEDLSSLPLHSQTVPLPEMITRSHPLLLPLYHFNQSYLH